MNKPILVLLLSIVIQITNAQVRKVDSFSELSLSGSITAELIPSDVEKVEYKIIKGDEEHLVIKNDGDELIIKTKGKWYSGTETKAKVAVYFKQLEELSITSGVSARVLEVIEAKHFDLEVSSGATCTMTLHATKADIEVSSGSSLTLDGKCERAQIEVSSGSSLKAGDFIIHTAEADVSSGSSAKLNVKESLTGEASSGSSLRYEGNPSEHSIEKDISSSVKRL